MDRSTLINYACVAFVSVVAFATLCCLFDDQYEQKRAARHDGAGFLVAPDRD